MVSTGGDRSARRTSSNVAPGSVWESRMRIDQVRGGIKVFNGGAENQEFDDKTENRASERTIGSAEKRRTFKSERNSIQIAGNRSPSQLQRTKTSASRSNGNGDCKSRGQFQRKKSASDAGDKRTDLKLSKTRDSLEAGGLNRSGEDIGGSDEEIEKGPIQLEKEKTRSDDENEEHDETNSGYVSGEDEVEEVKVRIDEKIEVEKNISLNEKFVVEKNISDCDYKQMNVPQISNSNSNSNPEFSLKPKISSKSATAIARSSSRAEFSPAKKPPLRFPRATNSIPIRDYGVNQRVPQTYSKLQSIVDLVMWKHVPRSSLVFGSGTFLIISLSYTEDLNISFFSVTSYLSLICLAIMFLYKSFKCRQITEGNDTNNCHGLVVIGEEEAIWVLRLILPYVNEFLLNLKALFSGDPVVTMKLAAVLFALARCGSYITIWKMVKLGFFAAFILPKLCSSYSTQATEYGMFWILRFQDAWKSCSHKKVVGFAIFTIVWNLSSVVARIWAVFMLFAAVRYYHQSAIKAESWDEVGVEGGGCNSNSSLQRQQVINKLRQGRGSTTSMHGTGLG